MVLSLVCEYDFCRPRCIRMPWMFHYLCHPLILRGSVGREGNEGTNLTGMDGVEYKGEGILYQEIRPSLYDPIDV